MKNNWKIVFWAVLLVIAVIGCIATIVIGKSSAYVAAAISVVFTAVWLVIEIKKSKEQ